MIGLLENLKDMAGKWHLVERVVEVDGEYYTFTQDRDTMLVTTTHGEAYARLSCRIEGKPAPEGWFWLRNWSENEEFWGKVAQHFDLGEETVRISPHVKTVAAKFRLTAKKEGE